MVVELQHDSVFITRLRMCSIFMCARVSDSQHNLSVSGPVVIVEWCVASFSHMTDREWKRQNREWRMDREWSDSNGLAGMA